MSDVTPEGIAQWMADRLAQEGTLYQADAVDEIAKRYGEQFTYQHVRALDHRGDPAGAVIVAARQPDPARVEQGGVPVHGLVQEGLP